MEKLSRTARYKNYRDGINNDSEGEITTKELRKLQDKIILNEKRFGNSSRTENDLIRGRRNASYDNFYDNYYGTMNDELDTPNRNEYNEMDDIFGEINKYRSNISRQDEEYNRENNRESSKSEFEDKDEYIRKIREIVNNAGNQSREPIRHETYSRENRYNVERSFEREKYTNQEIIERENRYNELVQQQNQQPQISTEVIQQDTKEEKKVEFNLADEPNENTVDFDIPTANEVIAEEEKVEEIVEKPVENIETINDKNDNTVVSNPNEDEEIDNTINTAFDEPNIEDVKEDNTLEESTETINENIEHEDSLANNIEQEAIVSEEEYVSPMEDIVLEKPEIKPLVPQRDESIAFKEICDTANTLADEIESTSSFAQSTYVPQTVAKTTNNSLEVLQNDINKDLMNLDKTDDFMTALELELNQYNNEDNEIREEAEELKEDTADGSKHTIRKSEVIEEMKEEYEHTVSFEVDKLMDEINSTKSDDISAEDIIKDNDLAKKDFNEEQFGKTIAFDVDEDINIPDNTIVLSKPDISEDSSIHTMSFKTEELDEKEEKNNTLLNIILTILVIVAIATLGVMAYFFLITRGII